MDGLIDFIIFAVFIGICIFFDKLSNVMKKTQKHPESGPVTMEIPTIPQPQKPIQTKPAVRKTTRNADARVWPQKREDLSKRKEFQNEGIRSTANVIQPIETQQRSEFAIDSADDARKAIIWSEILNRKY
jgi:hypothetical protein